MVPVRISYQLPVRPARQVETVLYFVACEAITNAAKHAQLRLITIEIMVEDGKSRCGYGTMASAGPTRTAVACRDSPAGSAALDGHFEVTSPAGGPTTIRVALPCA